MAIEITHVRFDGNGRSPSEIIAYKWTSLGTGASNDSDKPPLVRWVDEGGKAYVGQGVNRVGVAVVRPTHGDPYLRTYADGQYNNNLENLDTF